MSSEPHSDPDAVAASATPVPLTPPVPAPARRRAGRTVLGLVALLFAALALGVDALLLTRSSDWQQRLDQVQAEALARQQRDADAARRLSEIERRLDQAQADAAAGSPGDPDLQRHREALAFIDIERIVEEAQLQLRLGAAPAAAIDVLAAADARLGRLGGAPAQRVQLALRHDIARLKNTPDVDRAALAARLDTLIADVDTWHASADPTHPIARPASGAAVAAAAAPQTHPGAAQAREPLGAQVRGWLEREFGDLVRVREIDTPEALQLAPAQQTLLRDRVRFGVLDLREAILARDERTIRSEEAGLTMVLTRYFDPNQPGVAAALVLLHATAAAALPNSAPSLDETLAALRAARLAAAADAHAPS